MGDPPHDTLYNMRTILLKASTKECFYRIPSMGYPFIQVMNSYGEVVRKIPLPHPYVDKLPRTNEHRLKLMKTHSKQLHFISGADSDESGNLHLLLRWIYMRGKDGKLTSRDDRFVVKIDEQGTLLAVHELDRPVSNFTVGWDGNSYYATDKESDHLLHFAIQ